METPESLAERYKNAGVQLLDNWKLLALHLNRVLNDLESTNQLLPPHDDLTHNHISKSTRKQHKQQQLRQNNNNNNKGQMRKKQPKLLPIKIDYSNMSTTSDGNRLCSTSNNSNRDIDDQDFDDEDDDDDECNDKDDYDNLFDSELFEEFIEEEGFIPPPSREFLSMQNALQETTLLEDKKVSPKKSTATTTPITNKPGSVPAISLMKKRLRQMSVDLKIFVIRYEETLQRVIDQRKLLIQQQDVLVDQVAILRKSVPPDLRSVKATIPIKPYVPSFVPVDEQPPYIGIDLQHSHICMDEPGCDPTQYMEMSTPISGRPSVQTKYHKHTNNSNRTNKNKKIESSAMDSYPDDEEEEEADADADADADEDDYHESEYQDYDEDEDVDIDD